jgi:hypothetical protein
MGFFPGRIIENAVHFLLRELSARSEMRYSEMFDGTDETHRRLGRACDMNPEDAEDYGVELAIDLAVWEMENEGFLEKEDLEETLADGEQDYNIRITPEGEAFALSGKRHRSPGRTL